MIKNILNLKKSYQDRVSHIKKNLLSKKNRKKTVVVSASLLLFLFLYLTKGYYISAWVNGQPIFRWSVVGELEKNMGEQVLETLVTRKLIFQEALDNNVGVTEVEINEELEKTKKIVEEQGLTLENALESQGSTIEQLKENLRMRLTIEKLLGSDIEVTEDQIKADFENNKQFYGEDAQLDEYKDLIKDQLYQQELSVKYNDWIAKIKEEAEIKYFSTY
jgi:foldase protein PrsA